MILTRKLSIVLVLFLSGCGPGVFDYMDQVGNSNFYITYNDSSNVYVSFKSKSDNEKVIVDRNVVDYKYNSNFLVAVRQKKQSYECSNGAIATKFFSDFEYWIIDLKNNRDYGPLDFFKYKFKTKEMNIDSALSLENYSFYKKNFQSNTLYDCSNPIEIQ